MKALVKQINILMKKMAASAQPQHPLLPSGDWEGFYVYQPGSEQHKMQMRMDFENGVINGSGIDDVAPYAWRGTYDLKTMTCEMTKIYPFPSIVYYRGNIDENGIWGNWELMGRTGGFHIWPKKQKAAEDEAAEIKAKIRELVDVNL